MDRVEVLLVRGKSQEERVLGARRAVDRLEAPIIGIELVGVDAALVTRRKRRHEDVWVGRCREVRHGDRGEGGQRESENSLGLCHKGNSKSTVIIVGAELE